LKGGQPSPELAAALQEAERVTVTLQPFTDGLKRSEVSRVVAKLRAGLLPRRKPGRKPHARLDRAFRDWQAGLRGLPLYQQHIHNFAKMGELRRQREQRRLNEALRKRAERKPQPLPNCPPNNNDSGI
jgi:hypothetical protein